MMTEPVIKTLPEKKLVGKRMKMSLAENRTSELWSGFMPRRKEIGNQLPALLYSVQLYNGPPTLIDFNVHTQFEKWAAVEVADFTMVPGGMETFVLTGGLYAVFTYKGRASEFGEAFRYMLSGWLPASGYELDNRAHFEILGEKYKNEDPGSEEEIWMPVKKKE